MVLCLAAVATAGVPAAAQERPAAADEAVLEAAREHYRRGRELYGQGRLQDAIRELRVSYQLAPHWVTLNGMALCEEDLGNKREALRLYSRALADGGAGIPARQRSQIEGQVVALRLDLGLARLSVITDPPGAAVSLEGEPFGTTPFGDDIAAGEWNVGIDLDGHQSILRRIVVAAGESKVMDVTLAPPARGGSAPSRTGVLEVRSDPQGAAVFVDGERTGTTPATLGDVRPGTRLVRVELSDSRAWEDRVEVPEGAICRVDVRLPGGGAHQGWFWGTAAAAAALGIGGAATGAWGASLHSEYHDAGTDQARRDDIRPLGESLFDAADGLFVAAGAAGVAALVLVLFTDFGGPGADADVSVIAGSGP
ncbi:MAG: PEGA domain-containing protein [Myxococcota bacterium]|nr:PEGA domain-containing protein [Myxococcota bacterium]